MRELLAGEAAVREVEVVIVDGAELRAALLGDQRLVETHPVARREGVQLARPPPRPGSRQSRKVAAMVGISGIRNAGCEDPSPWVRGVVPVISVRRAGMQIGHSE
ncbi:MAG: hypothetical protein AcusKO_20000 [Acuticoccus sp.]